MGIGDQKMDLVDVLTSLQNISVPLIFTDLEEAFIGRSGGTCGPGSSFSAFGFLSFLMITFNLVVNITANVNSNSNANQNSNNNNMNMNMNTGRRLIRHHQKEGYSLFEDEDIWSLENLKNLINIKVKGGSKAKKRKDFADSQFVTDEWGGDILDASWVASQKMVIFGEQVIKTKMQCLPQLLCETINVCPEGAR